MSTLPVSFDDVAAAAKRIAGIVKRTPIAICEKADRITGATLLFKCESEQLGGAFKYRGATNALARFTPEQLKNGVIAFSSGNHAQAIARAAKRAGTRAIIVMPKDAPQVKVDATSSHGAEIIFYDRYSEDREAICRELAEREKMTIIPPYDHPHVIAGQGTLALELFEQAESLDVLVVPLGGGGMLSGCALVAKHINPNCMVIGVEPEAGNDGQRSFRGGTIVHIDPPKTIADGAQTQHLGQHTFPIIRALVDDIVTVSDEQLVKTMKFFDQNLQMTVEPTGCLAAAAMLEKTLRFPGKRVGVVLSGSNVDPQRFRELTGMALA